MKTHTLIFLLAISTVFSVQAQNYPEAREGATFIKLNDTLYCLFGGKATSNGEQTSNKSVKGLFLNSTYMFAHGWNGHADMCWDHYSTYTPPPGRTHHAAVTWHGKMYIIGGETAKGLTNQLWEYDPVTKIWSNKTPYGAGTKYITPRKDMTAVVKGNKLYLIGGTDGKHALTDAYVVEFSDGSYFMSEKIDTPVPGGAPPTIGAAGAALNGKIYMFGGRSDLGTTNSVISYDPEKKSWTVGTNNGFHSSYMGIATVHDPMACLWGGYSTTKESKSTSLYLYNAATGEKTLLSNNMPAGGYFNCGILEIDSTNKQAVDTLLYFWGGEDNQSFFRYSITGGEVDKYDSVSNEFTFLTAVRPAKVAANITVSPNPVSENYLKVCSEKWPVRRFILFGLNGEPVKQKVIEQKTFKVDLSGLLPGMYVLKLYTEQGTITRKVLKK